MLTLRQAFDEVYGAFAKVPRPRVIEGCPCCIEGKEVDRLLARPLREISPQELAPYAASAFLTVGNIADYRYFLPRILEVSATDDGWWPDVEITGRAIRDSQPENWQPAQRAAVRALFAMVIDDAVRSGAYFKLDQWMCAVARAGFEVAPLLERIGESRESVLAYYQDNAAKLADRALANPFWELPSEGHDEIVVWFYSEPIRRMLDNKV